MSKAEKMLAKIMSGKQDRNVRSTDLCNALSRLGFDLEISGSHHIYTKPGFNLINL